MSHYHGNWNRDKQHSTQLFFLESWEIVGNWCWVAFLLPALKNNFGKKVFYLICLTQGFAEFVEYILVSQMQIKRVESRKNVCVQ